MQHDLAPVGGQRGALGGDGRAPLCTLVAREREVASGADPHRQGAGTALGEPLLDDMPEGRRLSCRLDVAPTCGDPALLEVAVAELLENATHHGVAAGAIDVHSWTERDVAYLTVGNDGPRVDAADLERLFEPFVRGGHDGDGRGMGLGLAIVHAIVRAHGGSVAASARPRGGLDITVRLPRAP